jgi:peptide/nickel transport system substrate-binding protein
MPNRRQFLTSGSLGTLALSGAFGRTDRAFAAESDALTLAFPNDLSNWDPNYTAAPVVTSILKCVWDMPISLSSSLGFGPSVASTHRWLDTEGKILELTLRDDVTFHNGDKLTSDDVKFTFYDRIRADGTLMTAGLWGPARVDGIETPTPTTAIFHFKTPYVFAPKLLGASPNYIVPRRYFEQVGHDGFMQKPIGSGPYRLVDYQRDSRIVLEAYDKYWGGVAPIKHITFQIIKDPGARIAAIQAGQVDFAHSIPVREAERLGALPGLVADIHPVNSDYLIQMVNKGQFKDQNLRLAMHHAIDKQALSKAFFSGHAVPLSMWDPPGRPGFDSGFTFDYNPTKAKDLLARAGFTADKPAKIPFWTTNGAFPADYDMARAIVQMWQQVGIDADLSVVETSKYYTMAQSDTLEAPALNQWTCATGDPENWSGFILDPKRAYSVWKSDDVSPRLDPLFRETDEDKRAAGYRVFDRWAVEQGYAFPLLQGIATVVHSKRLVYVPWLNGWMLPYYWHLA